jgi:hypothetical protein
MENILSVDLANGLFLDPKKAKRAGEKYSEAYNSNNPFPHIVLDNLLPEAITEGLLANFPAESLRKDRTYDGYFEFNKRQVSPYYCKSKATEIFMFFNSAPFLQFLEGLTGIDGLISDPYFDGAGFHEIGTGGKLGIHADFRLNRKLHLARRLNLLVYLNKNWEDSYGGNLELWSRDMKNRVHSIKPVFNRCVVFNTDADSFHGHPDPLTCPPDVTRKSAALYYYTASRHIYDELPNKGTDFRARTDEEQKAAGETRDKTFLKRLKRLKRKITSRKRDI